jgi:hypothetical protein
VLILKGVKVVCFDTLLQVLILKNLYCSKNHDEVRFARAANETLGPTGRLQKAKTPASVLAV